ncbi:hypothetical protein Tco_0920806 [Tanacetum coccineum]
MYTPWVSHMFLYIKRKEHGRMMLNSVLIGPLVYPTVEVDGVTRPKTYEELSEKEKLQDDCDLHATNIVLQGLPPDIYALLNHNQLMNDIHIIGMTMQQVQVNTKFMNGLQPEWSKFVTDVKLAKNMYTTNYDQLYAYLSQHEGHANEVYLMRERLAVPLFLLGDNPIASLNKAMEFLSISLSLCFPTTNNQLRSSSNPRNQATIQDGRVIAQQVQGRESQGYAGHMARQFTQIKTPRNSTWFKEKLMLVEAQEFGQTDDLDAFDSDCDEATGTQAILMAHFSTYDSDIISEFIMSNLLSILPLILRLQVISISSLFDAISDQVAKCTSDNLKHKELDASLTTKLESYKERVKKFEDRQNVDLNDHEKFIESQMNDMILSKNAKFDALQKEIDTLKFTLSKHEKENASLITKIDALK